MLPEKLLWKYLGVENGQNNFPSPRTAFIDNQKFRITQPSALNDPFEMRPRVLLDMYSPEDWEVARKKARANGYIYGHEISDEEIEAFHLIPFPAYRFDEISFPGLWPAILPELRIEPFNSLQEVDEFRSKKICKTIEESLDNNIGILSLTRDPRNLLMWAHYGGEHFGIAVGFDRDHDFFRHPGTILSEVEYRQDRISVSVKDGVIRVAGHVFDETTGHLPINTLIRKDTIWKEEKEERFICPLSLADDEISNTPIDTNSNSKKTYLKKMPSESIKALALGARLSDAQVDQIANKVKSVESMKHVRIFRGQLHDTKFSLIFREI